MKYLMVIRHASAEKGSEMAADLDRPLTEEGKKNAIRLGRLLAAQGFRPGSIVSSPAVRAQATAEAVAAQLGISTGEIEKDERLYSQDVNDIVGLIREKPDHFAEVWLVGHNPTALDLINILADRALESLPAGGAVRIELDIERWTETKPLCGKISWHFPDTDE